MSTRPLALVTGASRGIGRALAGQFAAHGFDLVLAADDETVHRAASELSTPDSSGTQGTGVGAVGVVVDLATRAGVARLIDVLEGTGRPVAAAAMNAGVTVGGDLQTTDVEDHLRLVDLNCRSTVQLAAYLVPRMVEAGQGRLLFTSSIAAVAPGPHQATYAASKAFVHSFAEGVRHELEGTGVTVTSLLPGPTDTEIFDRGGMGSTRIAQGRKDDPDDVAGDAYDALMAGRHRVVTGPVVNRVQVAASGLLPDPVKAAVAGRETAPGSGSD